MENSNGGDGAIPPLSEVNVPEGERRQNGKMRLVLIFGGLVFAIIVVVVGLIALGGSKKDGKKAGAAVPEARKNVDVGSNAIERRRAEIEAETARDKERRQQIEAAMARDSAANASLSASSAASSTPTSEAAASSTGAVAPGKAPAAPAQSAKLPPTPRERKMDGEVLLDVMVGNSSGSSTNNSQPPQAPSAAPVAAGSTQWGGPASPAPTLLVGGTANSSSDSFAGKLKPMVLKAKIAELLPNQDFLLKQGTVVPCITKTQIDTSLPGFVLCQVMADVYSANGKVLLIERYSTVFGEQTAGLKNGQSRGFVLWSRIDNPNGVTVEVESPAADQSGASGIPGYVDHHLGERFGAAVMLSVFKDASAAVFQRGNGQQSGSTQANTVQTTNDFATEALKKGIDIPPTGTVLPGTVVFVMVARNISFDSVYGTR